MTSLLPSNATPAERALAEAAARLSAVPVPIDTLWDPDRCPAALLPWLACALSVDGWDPAWTEAQRRAVIRASVEVHIRKGTRSAVMAALRALGVTAQIIEWHQPGAQPGALPKTFELWLDLMPLLREGADMDALLARLRRSVDAAKPVAAHYTAHARIGARTRLYGGVGTRVSGRLGNRPGIPPAPRIIATLHAGVASRASGWLDTPVLEAP